MNAARPALATSRLQTTPVVLIGLDTLQGLQAARTLAGRGIAVIALASDPRHPACRTRVCREIISADTKGTGLVPALLALRERLAGPALLLPCHDQAVRLLAAAREVLARAYRLNLPPAAALDLAMHKERLYAFASERGFSVPATRQLDSLAAARRAAAELRFPCILKPAGRAARWDRETTSKAFRVETPGELEKLFRHVADWAPTLLLQELVPGGDDALYSCNACFDRNAQPIAAFSSRKLRQWPPGLGSGCAAVAEPVPPVLELGLRLLQQMEFTGLGYVEFKRDPRSGEYLLIEVNAGRPTGRSAMAEACGVELLLAWYRESLGMPLPAALAQSAQVSTWVDLRHDLQAAYYYWRRGKLRLRDWLRSLAAPRTHALASWQDPLPFVFDLLRSARLALSPGERARRRAAFAGGRKHPGTKA